jgi:hypothetical protein
MLRKGPSGFKCTALRRRVHENQADFLRYVDGMRTFPRVRGYNNFCGGACEYTTGVPISGWNTTGFNTGQLIMGGYAGNPGAFDGNVMAYTDTGTISQAVGTVDVGELYTLQVEILHRTDVPMTGIAQITIGGVPVALATGTDPGAGNWSNWTAHYTATPADAGKPLGILLSTSGPTGQGDFDLVRFSVPEHSNLVMLLGFGIFNLAAVLGFRRKLV